jgi:MFS family permease
MIDADATDGMTNSFGVFQEYYTYTHPIHTVVDATAISWIGSIQYTLCPLLGCIAGPLFDAGYLKSLIFAGGSLYVFSLMMTSIATQYWQVILAHGLGVGLGMGLFFSPSVSTLSHHFQRSRYRTVAYGLQATGSSIGGIVYPIMMRALIPRVGFGWAMRTCESAMRRGADDSGLPGSGCAGVFVLCTLAGTSSKKAAGVAQPCGL